MAKLHILVLAAIALILPPLVASQELAKVFVYHGIHRSIHGSLYSSMEHRQTKYNLGDSFDQCGHGRQVLMAGDGIPTVVAARTVQDAFVRVARQIEVEPSGKNKNPVLEVLSPEQARLDMVDLAYVSPKKVFSPSVVRRSLPTRAAKT